MPRSELLQTGAPETVNTLAFREDAAWDALQARDGRWWQLSDADLARLFVAKFTTKGDVWDFDPETLRAEAEALAGGRVVLIY